MVNQEKSPSLNSLCDTCKKRIITIQVCYDCVKERDNKLRNQTLADVQKIIDRHLSSNCDCIQWFDCLARSKEEIKNLEVKGD